MMRAIPKDCELMRRANADAPGVRETIDTILYPPPVTVRDRELAALVENGQSLFDDGSAGLVPASRVNEVAHFLECVDPEVNTGERWTSLEEILHFYRRAAAFQGLAVVVAYL